MNLTNKTKFILTVLIILIGVDLIVGDENLFLFINKTLANRVIDILFLNVFIPLFFVLPLVPLIGIFNKKYGRISFIALLAAPVSYFTGAWMKELFLRPRPFTVLDARIVGPWNDPTFSFPSTTTILAFSLALPFFLFSERRVGYLLLFLAFAVAFFVVYSGFHYPSDAISGIGLSLLFVLGLERLFHIQKIKKIINKASNLLSI